MVELPKRNNLSGRGLFTAARGRPNTVLNFQHNPEGEFDLYGEAFHRAGKALAARIESDDWFHSLDACPIVYLYRQALELHFKSIIITGNAVFRLQGSAEPVNESKILRTHSLRKLLTSIRPIMEEMGWMDDASYETVYGFAEMQRVIHEFDDIDPKSYAFRYPVDSKGRGSVSHHFSFDVRAFVAQLDPILDLLAGATMGIDDAYQNMCDAYSQM